MAERVEQGRMAAAKEKIDLAEEGELRDAEIPGDVIAYVRALEAEREHRPTRRQLHAIIEALTSRLAGEIDIAEDADALDVDDYEAALDWASTASPRAALQGGQRDAG